VPPHCDAKDGPVVRAAVKALETKDVKLILPYVHQEAEPELIDAFNKVLPLRQNGKASRELADDYFFETVVRLHRAGEGAPYTGLKPAGMDVGPVIPVAEAAIESGFPDQLADLLTTLLADEIRKRFEGVTRLKHHATESVDAARAYVSAMLGLQVWSHKLYLAMKAEAHASSDKHC